LAPLAGALTLILWAALAWAAEETGQPPAAAPPPPTMEVGFTGALVKMVGGLAGVLALMLLLYWLVRRFLPGQGVPLRNARIRMLGRLGLGQRSQVAMVQVGDKVLILGVTPTNVNLLDKVDSIDELGEGGGESQVTPAVGFMDTLKRVAGKEDQGS
jgi:flagellar protein FliO/FliZ